MLKFLTDENIFPSTLEILRSYNFDVMDIKESGLIGISDREIMDLAKREGRIIISLDLHFANIFLFPPNECPGIIVIRIKPAVPAKVDRAMEDFLQRMDPKKIEKALVIISEDKFRIRR
ncbi:DUF5615 family PIN-like protein [Neomoorella thermoacetica]|uniref:DUF5615 family PIN-like protein n=1 Tax=Neomoorella thermoacetica TaxID=1525 RepID=UPI0008FBBA84|nr:DUF5615 family PIN-like protein [Moorella thermoacetica]APC08578.1 hypothetical protein MTJW_14190 [Moorella thermoacetica]